LQKASAPHQKATIHHTEPKANAVIQYSVRIIWADEVVEGVVLAVVLWLGDDAFADGEDAFAEGEDATDPEADGVEGTEGPEGGGGGGPSDFEKT
jgi:hypothetical protein